MEPGKRTASIESIIRWIRFDFAEEAVEETFSEVPFTPVIHLTDPPAPKVRSHCPAPNITYNGSLLSGGATKRWVSEGSSAFLAVREVEFMVKIGPDEIEDHAQKCKLICKDAQWIGPLCRISDCKHWWGWLGFIKHNKVLFALHSTHTCHYIANSSGKL